MQTDSVHHLLSLLQLSLGALNELGLRPHRVVVPRSGEGSSKLRDLPCRLVNGDDVAGDTRNSVSQQVVSDFNTQHAQDADFHLNTYPA